MNNLFRDHVTEISFNLSLTKNMCLCLFVIDDNHKAREAWKSGEPPIDTWNFAEHCNKFTSGARALVDRGLVIFELEPARLSLTKAGELALGLLVDAGIKADLQSPFAKTGFAKTG